MNQSLINRTVNLENFAKILFSRITFKDIFATLGIRYLELVQPRKTRLCLTERLLMGRKESNQTNKQIIQKGQT